MVYGWSQESEPISTSRNRKSENETKTLNPKWMKSATHRMPLKWQ